MAADKCAECGVPKRVGAKHRWKDNGVIVAKGSDMRGVWMEGDLLSAVLGGIEERLGIPIDHIIIDAKRRGAKIYVDNVLAGPLGKALRLKRLRKLAYDYMIKQAEAIGLAQPRILSYKPGQHLVLEALNVYNNAIFTGDVCGAFESIEGTRAKAEYEEGSEKTTIRIETWHDAPDEERLWIDYGDPLPAQAGFSRCSSCGTPKGASRWQWNLEQGRVIDGSSGAWLIFIDIGGINAVFRELERELGEEIPQVMMDSARRFYAGLREKGAKEAHGDLSFLALRGFGVPVPHAPTREDLANGIKVLNPFNMPIVAGAVAGIMADGEEKVGWTGTPEAHLELRLEHQGL